jgi:radical SAM family uncharacterized protein/radical SAM-linked protein
MESRNFILGRVRRPSRYLGNEVHAKRRDPLGALARVCLAFPDLYEVGASHLGLPILYEIINSEPQAAADRVFCPDTDMEELLRREKIPLFSLEWEMPLKDFDILGISLLYELNYTSVLTLLDLAGIPFRSKDRGAQCPIVLGGGPCTVNPEPVADFFDALVVGEGEEVIRRLLQAFLRWKADGTGGRDRLLEDWAAIEGVYIPALFDRAAGRGQTPPRPVRRAVVPDMDAAPYPLMPVIPYGKPVHDRLRLEIARGCGRGCRFCQAGMIYRPYREKSAGLLLAQAEQSLCRTGYQDLSLLSLSTGDYSQIEPLVGRMMERFGPDYTALSLPSMRADTLSPALMEQIRSVRKTGFTIAPEAGTQRLRNIINKNIDEKDIFDTVLAAGNAGWRLIKLYFMVGLPFETLEDVTGIVELVKRLKKICGRRQDISVSVGVFVPKAHTPFQWAAQLGEDEAWERINLVRDSLKIPGVKVKWQNPRTSIMEGALARGGREMAAVVETAWRKGCRLDGWSEHFNFDSWLWALEQHSVSIADITRARDIDEPLPWDNIDCRVEKGFLSDEWKRAGQGILTPACQDSCSGCGVCGPEKIAVRISPPLPEIAATPAQAKPQPDAQAKFRVYYSKTGPAKYLAHLETITIFLRALRRMGAPLAYSQGFHPMPAIAFDQALPVYVQSTQEHFTVTLTDPNAGNNLVEGLNMELPQGLKILFCEPVVPGERKKASPAARYCIECAPGTLKIEAVAAFNAASAFEVEKKNPKGQVRALDLKALVERMEIRSDTGVLLELRPSDGNSMKPDLVLQAVGAVTDASQDILQIVKSPVEAVGATES